MAMLASCSATEAKWKPTIKNYAEEVYLLHRADIVAIFDVLGPFARDHLVGCDYEIVSSDNLGVTFALVTMVEMALQGPILYVSLNLFFPIANRAQRADQQGCLCIHARW